MAEQSETEVNPIDDAMKAIQSTEPDKWESHLEQTEETQPEATETTEETQETQETQEEEKFSKSEYYARLIEKDREIRELKERSRPSDLDELAKTDPMAVLEKLGIGLDQVLDSWVGGEEAEEPANNSIPNEELEALKSELAEFKKQNEKSAYQIQYRAEIENIDKVASAEPEKWEIINGLKGQGAHDLVLETATERYKDTGEAPDYADVLDAIEQHIEDEFIQNYEQMIKFNKIKTRLHIPEAIKQTEQQQVEEIERPTIQTTLSSDMTSETQLPGTPTEEERVKRAIALLNQQGD